MKKLNLLIALLIIGLSVNGQIKEVDIKSTQIYKGGGITLRMHEQGEDVTYTLFYTVGGYQHIVVMDYAKVGELDETIEFFETVLLAMEDKDKKFQNEKFYISHQNKSAAYISPMNKNHHFFIRKKHAKKMLDILKS
jgi:hypothetical protein